MKFYLIIFLILNFTLNPNEARANTLSDSLNLAYSNNLKLNAERASMRASKEEKRESIGEFLPNVTISGYVSEQDNTGGNISFNSTDQYLLEDWNTTYESLSGMLAMVQPMDIQWWQLSSSTMGGCVSGSYEYTDVIYLMDFGETTVFLQGPNGLVSLYWDPTTYLFSNDTIYF